MAAEAERPLPTPPGCPNHSARLAERFDGDQAPEPTVKESAENLSENKLEDEEEPVAHNDEASQPNKLSREGAAGA
jgi:hypothetical protein